MALDNVLFDNHEAGLALEGTARVVARDNRLVGNAASQLLVTKASYDSDRNCFQSTAGQLTAEIVHGPRFATLAEYQRVTGQDRGSRAGRCGPLPETLDVRRLRGR